MTQPQTGQPEKEHRQAEREVIRALVQQPTTWRPPEDFEFSRFHQQALLTELESEIGYQADLFPKIINRLEECGISINEAEAARELIERLAQTGYLHQIDADSLLVEKAGFSYQEFRSLQRTEREEPTSDQRGRSR